MVVGQRLYRTELKLGSIAVALSEFGPRGMYLRLCLVPSGMGAKARVAARVPHTRCHSPIIKQVQG